jgi:hypothetical protein
LAVEPAWRINGPLLSRGYRLSRQAEYSRRQQSEVAEIGAIPAVVHPDRKALCKYDLALYAQSYYPHSAGLSPFSPGHLRALERMQRAILVGGYFLQIVFRGWAKSTLTEIATAWGVSYGHLRFPVPIAADAGLAKTMLDSIKSEFETNDLLLEDFPEICWPVRALEGKPQRCQSQTHNGQRTFIEWTAEHIVLPTVAGSPASGAIVMPLGITASLRGIRHKRHDGEQVRPDFVIVDDPQTDTSARSPSQVENRLKILTKTILRLGGHKKKLAVVVNATIIEPDDLPDRLSNAENFPAWQSEKIPMLESFAEPKAHDGHWLGKYAELRNDYDKDTPGDQERAHAEATAYYLANRQAMDKGAKASWVHCFEHGTEVSAVQHAYNILIDTGHDAFMAECQNQPVAAQADFDILNAGQICKKVSGFKQGEFPKQCSTLTAFIDVQGSLLYWLVAAWQDDFTGYVIDYGSWPDQKRKYFTLRDARNTLRRKYPGRDDEAAIFVGLTDCIAHVCGREWRRDDGATLRIRRCMVDANWGQTSSLVNLACRQSPLANVLTPSYGRGIKATQLPIRAWQIAKGKKCGPEWAPTEAKGKQLVGVIYDVNYWKKRFHDALALPLGMRGAIALYNAAPVDHRMVADQWAAEIPKKVESDGRVVFEWERKPNQDEHLHDAAVGAMVAASLCGVTNRETPAAAPRKKRRIAA